jgi:glycosyltransferase involved in cell wall biosynthesis
MPVKRCDVVVAISEKTKSDVCRLTGCCQNKVVVIPNPVSTEFRYSEKPFDSARPTVLQVGTRYNKNVMRLIEAVKGLGVRVLFIGNVTKAQEHALVGYGVEWEQRSNLADAEVACAYRESDIVTFVSCSEGFGLPIVEAQATGRPVLTSDRSPMREVAGGGARLVDPGDVGSIRRAIIELIENPETRNELVRKGRENVARFQAMRVAEQYAELYRSVSASVERTS